jgi:tricarballylate dehydrogenase
VTRVTAETLEALSSKLEYVDPQGFLQEVQAYNSAVQTSVPFNPNIKDGRCTSGLAFNKSNWANRLDSAPFEAYAVTCGITFTFGGLRIDNSGGVINTDGLPIRGLYAAGELVGGLFYFNYPGGTGLTSGSVFGRLAGISAARLALSRT